MSRGRDGLGPKCPVTFAVRAKIYRVLYNQASSIAFDETSSYWSALKCS